MGGPAKDVSWTWALPQVGKTVSGCGPTAPSCVVRAEFPTSGWQQVCISGASSFGGWSSCGMVYILDHGYEVSGTITMAGSGDPAPDVTVEAKCASGGTTTTDKNGDYNFILDQGQCTIAPEAPAGETSDPETHVVDVGDENIDGVDFDLSGILYFKVEKGLSVTSEPPGGHDLIKAGTSFTEQVTLKDLSGTKIVVVAPIYPALQGNADGGSLQPVGGIVQRQLSSLGAAGPSPIVVLKPGEQEVFDSVIATVASQSLGTDDGRQKVSGGTRAYVQFKVPRAFVLTDDDDLKPVDPSAVEVAKGSTDKITVSIDDSAPDQTPYNAYLATYDVSVGLKQGILHVTYGLVHGIFWDLPELAAKGVINIPTAFLNYVDLEAQLWREAQDDPAEMALLMDSVTNSILLIYKQAPFLLKKLGDIKASVDAAVSQHFDTLEHDWYVGDWENAVTTWTDDSTNFVGNSALLFVNPTVIAGAIGDATIARVPGLLKALYAADDSEFVADTSRVEAAVGTGEAAHTAFDAEKALDKMVPGLILNTAEMAKVYGISQQMFAELAAFCEKYDILVTLRSRASEAISLIEDGLSTVKPAAIKLKTVNKLDIKYLGFPPEVQISGRTVSSVGQVVVREPIFLATDCPASCALLKFQNSLLADNIARDSAEYYQLQYRWIQRSGEWINPGEGYIHELRLAADSDELTLDWHWQENHIDPSLTQTPETVGFRMSKQADGSLLPEVCETWQAATKICSGGQWKSVTGDVDLVSVTGADGSPLSDKAYSRVLQELGATSVDIQHPATATWYNDVDDVTSMFDPTDPDFSDKAKYVQANECCVMQVGPDGQARAVRLDLQGSSFVDKNNYFLNYVGRYMAPAP